MGKFFSMFFKTFFVCLIVGWIVIILIDYINARKERTPYFCLKTEVKEYSDGKTTICTGLGYKIYDYNRQSINAIEFGPLFTKEKVD